MTQAIKHHFGASVLVPTGSVGFLQFYPQELKPRKLRFRSSFCGRMVMASSGFGAGSHTRFSCVGTSEKLMCWSTTIEGLSEAALRFATVIAARSAYSYLLIADLWQGENDDHSIEFLKCRVIGGKRQPSSANRLWSRAHMREDNLMKM